MGFSPGKFIDASKGRFLHWEVRGNGNIMLWGPGELELIAMFTQEEAKKVLSQLDLLIQKDEQYG